MSLNGRDHSLKDEPSHWAAENSLMQAQLLMILHQVQNNSQFLLRFQEKLFASSFELWKRASQAQINVGFDLFQLTVNQTLSARERLGIIVEYALMRHQEITISEQRLTFDAAEIIQAQSEAVYERVIEMITPPPNTHHR